VRSIAFVGIITFVPLYAIRVVHASVPQANGALAALLVCGAVGTIVGGRIIDRIGRIPVLLISMFSAAPLLVALILATSRGGPFAIVACIAIAGLFGLLFIPSQTAFVVLGQEYLPNHLGIAAGVSLGLAISLGGAAAPLLGLLGDRSGLTATMWANVGLILIAGTLAILLAFVSRRLDRAASPA
jgi:FSR family fosmidomycin resistance protein-like MFS transporter